ncbi:protease modulator HflC [Planococcus liqunii]|uniref:Protein HflC n=1 Tax=Planococcus liqunii TaxID=3058394 RepID=A0ABT8MQA1_9BACL|nr:MULTISPECIES: protease modulator HflC [unclassified Planococcus (in: firmicutes)]MDN7227045.1 protease modulator HflC [Planococcus sp. N064]WKA52369.1 protease modulator HflC [Planococcus sp. N056]
MEPNNPFQNPKKPNPWEKPIKPAKPKKERPPKEPIQFKKYWKLIVGLSVALFALIVILTNIYVVKENEYRVVRQFGEVVTIQDKPGIRMKIPFLQSVTTLPKYQMTYDVSEAEINTKDKKRIIIDNYAVWQVVDPIDLITNAVSIVNAESRMEEFIYSVVRTELGQLNYDEIINDGNSSRGNLNDNVTARVNELLEKDQYGIKVVDVRMKRTDLPEENEQSVYTRMISERDSTAQDYLSQGDAKKREIEAQADREAQEVIATARKEAALIQAEGESEAAKIYNQSFSKDPEFYGLYRSLSSYTKTIGEDTVIILPSDSPYAQILSGNME